MSELLIKLWQNGILQLGIWETVYMTLISTFFAYLIGLPVGLILRCLLYTSPSPRDRG